MLHVINWHSLVESRHVIQIVTKFVEIFVIPVYFSQTKLQRHKKKPIKSADIHKKKPINLKEVFRINFEKKFCECYVEMKEKQLLCIWILTNHNKQNWVFYMLPNHYYKRIEKTIHNIKDHKQQQQIQHNNRKKWKDQ